ncbi:MAG: GNAT family N-acetyltransferase, partial [Actinobacteria bacterium]|nr:GNAT family N-acetyltransferase [Actinomycetota bacterium]
MALKIVTVDEHDDAALGDWYAVEGAATAHDRPVAVREPYSALVGSVRTPSAYRRTVLLLAELDGERVGAAAARTSLQDNLHLADLEIYVHPDHRRRGVGTALHDA